MRKHVVLDRFEGKPLIVTIMRGDKKREYTGKNAEKLAKHFGLHKKQTFMVIPNA
ncbi:MAG: hypothetical protein ACXABY_02480 [Candidatus Thorarchaeota archaeon]